MTLSSHLLILRYVENIFNKHPPLPKYVNIWNISQLLTYIKNFPVNSELSFKFLCKKVVVLFLILEPRRKDSLLKTDINNVLLENKKLILLLNKNLKYSAPQRPIQPFVYHKYKGSEKLYIVHCLQFYILERGKQMDNTECRLIITHRKPHHHASHDTLSRLMKEELPLDVKVFNALSYRVESASNVKQKGISLNDILKTACWSKEHMFKKPF